jgi:hypothetical protein
VAPLSGSDHEHRIGRLEKDMWHGNGKPGLTTRMQQAEDALSATKINIEDTNKRISSTDRKFWAIILLLLTLLGGLAMDLVKAYSAPERHPMSTLY